MTKHHVRSVEETLEDLSVDPERGLDEAEVRRRRGEHGRNRLGEAERASPWKILGDQFRNLVIGILAVAAVVSFAMGEIVQMAAILAAKQYTAAGTYTVSVASGDPGFAISSLGSCSQYFERQ
jgi:Ca2+-transporting ATPase